MPSGRLAGGGHDDMDARGEDVLRTFVVLGKALAKLALCLVQQRGLDLVEAAAMGQRKADEQPRLVPGFVGGMAEGDLYPSEEKVPRRIEGHLAQRA